MEEAEEAEREAVFGRGGEIPAGKREAEILYGEMDGLYLSLQRERIRRAEARVGILYTGKVAIGKGRYKLKDKLSIAGLVESSEAWEEMEEVGYVIASMRLRCQ